MPVLFSLSFFFLNSPVFWIQNHNNQKFNQNINNKSYFFHQLYQIVIIARDVTICYWCKKLPFVVQWGIVSCTMPPLLMVTRSKTLLIVSLHIFYTIFSLPLRRFARFSSMKKMSSMLKNVYKHKKSLQNKHFLHFSL